MSWNVAHNRGRRQPKERAGCGWERETDGGRDRKAITDPHPRRYCAKIIVDKSIDVYVVLKRYCLKGRSNLSEKGTALTGGRFYYSTEKVLHRKDVRAGFMGKGTPRKGGRCCVWQSWE